MEFKASRTGACKLVDMVLVQPCPIPDQTMLGKYQREGAYVDCYFTEIGRSVSQREYVEAFYSGAAFRLERLLLAWFVSKPSTDLQVRELASGAAGTFAAWKVEDRSADQLLLRDYRGSTRSWLMVEPVDTGSALSTRLYFGSAVLPALDKSTGQKRMGFLFKALLGFHKIYSRVLLHGACGRLERRPLP